MSYDADAPAVCANFIARIRPRSDQVSRYWLYALSGSYASGLTWKSVKQTTGIQNLDLGAFFSEHFPSPGAHDQMRIVKHLDRETAKIDELIGKTERMIELSRERRSVLITAAVTGQIDVSGQGMRREPGDREGVRGRAVRAPCRARVVVLPNDDGYDRQRALFPEDVFAWLKEIQPDELAKKVKPSMSDQAQLKARDGILTRLAGVLDKGRPVRVGRCRCCGPGSKMCRRRSR